MDLLDCASLYYDSPHKDNVGLVSCNNSVTEMAQSRDTILLKNPCQTGDFGKSGILSEQLLSQLNIEHDCQTPYDPALVMRGHQENVDVEKPAWTNNFKGHETENHTMTKPTVCILDKDLALENIEFLKEAQEAVRDKRSSLYVEGAHENKKELECNKTVAKHQENELVLDETVVKVVDDDVVIAWTDVKQMEISDGCHFYCSICNASFKSLVHVIVHLRLHDISKPYHCIWCKDSSQTEFEAKVHYRSHSGVQQYTCADCGRQFSKEKLLERHRSACSLRDSGLRRSFQPSNNKQTSSDFENRQTDFSNISSRKLEAAGSFSDRCQESFSTVDELARQKPTNNFDQDTELFLQHIANNGCDSSEAENTLGKDMTTTDKQHKECPTRQGKESKKKNKTQRNFICLTCGKAFQASKPLKEHEVVHTGAREFPCEICGKAFGTRANMKIHLSTHSDKKPFACDVCDATFRQKDSLKVHLRKHNGERPFVCSVCKMTFDRNFTLKNHLLTHGEVRSFVCIVCGKAFTTRGGLNNHERLHSKDPSEKKERKPPSKPGTGNWICDECGKMYSTRSNLRMHQRSHQAVTVTYPCCVCGRAYKHKDSLEVHMRRHRDQRPYNCPTCGRNFYRNWTLKLHILTHTGEKPHKCLVTGCDKAFTQSSSLYYHVQSHGKKVERAKKISSKGGAHQGTDGNSNSTVNIPDNPATASGLQQSDPTMRPNAGTTDSLENDHRLETSQLFVTNPLSSSHPGIPNPTSSDIPGSSIENDSLSIDSVMNGANAGFDCLARETLSIKVAVEGIHSSVLNEMVLDGLDALGPSNAHIALADSIIKSSLSQSDSSIPQDTIMNHVIQPLDMNSSVGPMCETDVTSGSVWGNTVLPFTMNTISEHPTAISPLQPPGPPPLRPLSQTLDQPLFVLSSGTDSVPLLVSVDGHLYQQDMHGKATGLQNAFVQQLH